MKRIVAIALAAIMVLVFLAGCGGGSAEDAAGTYTVKSIGGKSVEDAIKEELGEYGAALDLDSILSMLGIDSLEDYMTMELKSDGSAVMSVAGNDETGSWSQSGSKVTITFDDDPQEFTLSGNELSAETDGVEYVFVKK